MLPMALLAVMVTAFYIPNALSYVAPTRSGIDFHATNSQVVQVWFDSTPQLTTAYPPAYLFNVAAKTVSGLWITSLHWNFGDGSTLDVPFSGQSQVSEIRAHQYVNQANYCVSVTAYDNAGNTATATVSLKPNFDFNLTVKPTTRNVTQGGSATYTVTVDSSCGSSVLVNLAISSLPQGVSGTIKPPSAYTPFNSTVQVNTTTNTPKGTYTITIIGTSATITHTVTMSLVVNAPYFTLSVSSPSLFVPAQPDTQPARTNSTTVIVQSFNGFNSNVTLTRSPPPTGMTAVFSPPTVKPLPNEQATSILTIMTPCSVSRGSYAIIVNGTSGTLVKQATVTVTVSACTESPNPPWIVLGMIGSLIAILLLFLLLRNRSAVVPAILVPAIVPPPILVVQQIPCCAICSKSMVFVEQFQRWYCDTCNRYA